MRRQFLQNEIVNNDLYVSIHYFINSEPITPAPLILPACLAPPICLQDARARVGRAPSIVMNDELKAMSLYVMQDIIADL